MKARLCMLRLRLKQILCPVEAFPLSWKRPKAGEFAIHTLAIDAVVRPSELSQS